MTIAFYLLFVFFSADVQFSWGWLLLAVLMSGGEAKRIYRYTTDPRLEGQEVRHC